MGRTTDARDGFRRSPFGGRRTVADGEVSYRSLVERVPAVVYIDAVDDVATASYVSPYYETLLGYTPEERLADPELWIKCLHPEDRERVIAESLRTNRTGDPFRMEYRMVARDGRVVWVSDDAVMLHDDSGRPLCWQGVLIDITERKHAEEALRKAYDREREVAERLRSVDEIKNAFLTAVSHELRTPLASVLGYALTLEQNDIDLSPDQRSDMLRRLAANARKLDRLLSDLLDLDRLSRGIMEPHRQDVDVSELVRGVVAETDLDGRVVQVEAQPLTARVDGPKVERILENLLVNAARHTPPDSSVFVSVLPDRGGVQIRVEDEGPGVPDDMKRTLFQPFERGSRPLGHAPGTGIGLSLVARFAELHGGEAWVVDRPGGGASFRIFLPSVSAPVEQIPVRGQVRWPPDSEEAR